MGTGWRVRRDRGGLGYQERKCVNQGGAPNECGEEDERMTASMRGRRMLELEMEVEKDLG
jgi:hypothetical protein